MALEDTREDRRDGLRRATQDAHSRVETIIDQAGMFASLPGYLRYLEATCQVRRRLEQDLDASGAGDIYPLWQERKLAALIAADVADLHGEMPAAADRPPNLLSAPELLGALYVLEGSALGARILVRHAADLGLSASYGARHLHAQAADRGAWRAFVSLLTASDEAPSAEAARSVFDMFASAYRGEAVTG